MAPSTLFVFILFLTMCITAQVFTRSDLYEDDNEIKCKKKHPKFEMDKAILTINSSAVFNMTLYMQSGECDKCDLLPVKVMETNTSCIMSVDARYPLRIEIRLNNATADKVCGCGEKNLSIHLEERGDYFIIITRDDSGISCTKPYTMNDPPDSNIPIYAAMGIFVGLSLCWIFMKYLYRRHLLYRILCCFGPERLLDPDLGVINPVDNPDLVSSDKSPSRDRLRSLDTFRGISIVVMIFVNYGGGGYWFFKHSRWNGVTVADLVFPWFIFIMGASMAFSFKSLLRRATSKRCIFMKIAKRTVILFAFGLLINSKCDSAMDMTFYRIPGVLQRFAITYFIVAGTHMFCAQAVDAHQHVWWAPIRDVLDYWPEWIVNLILIGVHTAITFGLPVPNCPTGYLGPGGLHDSGRHENCTGGASGYIDRMFFNSSHIYQHPTCKEIYDTYIPYDPEGILGSLTSCVICFLGLQAGKILLIYVDWVQRLKRFLVWAVITGGLALILCNASKNDGWIPINKNLWSVSYVLAMASTAFILIAICYMMIDVWQFWSGAPFYYPGMNAILLYMGHEFFTNRFPVAWKVGNNHTEHLALNLWGTAFWVLVAYYLNYRKIYISV